jgi:hypothetical protein
LRTSERGISLTVDMRSGLLDIWGERRTTLPCLLSDCDSD